MATKKKIKSKLAKAMNEEHTPRKKYSPTEEDCMKWFRIINREVFCEKLPEFTEIEVRRRRGCWGECIGNEDEQGNRTTYLSMNHRLRSKKHFLQVLTHEMIHHWEFINYGTMAHTEKFMSWKGKLKRFNLALEISN